MGKKEREGRREGGGGEKERIGKGREGETKRKDSLSSSGRPETHYAAQNSFTLIAAAP